MSKIKLTGESSGYVEISAGNAAGNNTLEAPTSGTRLVAHEGSQDVTLNGNLTVNGVVSYEDVTNIDSVGVMTARSGLQVTSGHIGVGVTPESWSSNLRAVQIGRQACITGQTNHNIVEISANAYHNSGIWKYIETDTATSYYQYQGNHVFSSAPSGTADDAITFSEKLRITSGGQSKFTVGTNKYVKIYAATHNDEADLGAGIAFSRPSDGADMLSGMFAHSNTGLGIAARDHITFLTGGTSNVSDTEERLRITSAGLVGVNVIPTQQKLTIDVDSSGTTQASFDGINICNTDSTTNNGAAIVFGQAIAGNSYSRIGVINSDRSGGSEDQDIFFGTLGGGSYAERLRITSDGRLLLGTTDAGGNNTANHLVVANNSSASDQAGITIRGGTSGRSQIFFSDGNSGQDEYRGMLRYDHSDNSMQFRTDAVEKVRINTSGTLIVDAGGEAQDIQIISHSGGGGHGKIYLRGNASNESSSIQLNHYGHADYHVSAGRAGNGLFSITRTQGGTDGIIMNANGNVGIKNIGTSAKLHIGDLVGSVSSDINTTHTSLIIKQTNNDLKSGFYIERSGERKGYYMWMNPGGGSGDGLTFTRNNNGTKSDAFILDRDANLWGGGTFYPLSDNAYDLGSSSNRWRNVYTTDLQLSNEGSQNDVDGTWGSYTIQEGEDELFLINRRNGKKYKFNLTEVN